MAPRAVFTDFPLGNTAGPPHDRETQLAIARSALEQVHSAGEAGTIRPLGHERGEPWKDEARELKDHRTERFDSPQYQEPSDRETAISIHGEDRATALPS